MAAGHSFIRTAFVVLFRILAVVGQEYEPCPSGCTCLGINVDCSEKDLVAVPESIPSWAESLDLSSNNIEEIPAGAFHKLLKLKFLILSDNKLSNLNSSLFAHLPELTKLVLDRNALTEIPIFDWNNSLTHLSLDKNDIESWSYDALTRLPKLEHLDLSNNKLRNLTNGTFPILPKLQHLHLNNVKLQWIEAGALDNVTSLKSLKLNKNRLESIPINVFNKLKSLQELHLNRNKIKVLEGLRFKGLTSLQDLKMKKNLIHELMDGCFFGLEKIQTLELDNNAITEIKAGGLYGMMSLQHLSLSNNNISYVEGWTKSPGLLTLNLERNALTSIRKDNLTGLKSLKQLHLSYNKISYIEKESFKELGKLQHLDLSRNLWTIEGIESTFVGLNSISRLILENNQIKSVSSGAFEGLESLQLLDLNHNAINTIQAGAFSPLESLTELKINASSLLCDCHLAWFPRWVKQERLDKLVNAKCAHPENLKNKSIFEAAEEEFLCNGEPKPVILEHPRNQIALKGGNATLSCTAGSSSESMMRFHWKKDNIRLMSPVMETLAKASENNSEIVQWISRLHLSDITDRDDGDYQCVVSNDLGEAFSDLARVAVHVFPTFVKVPSDVTVKAGSAARLDCAAKGEPIPEVAWQKDGGDDFPAARERRMHVMPTDDVFFITGVKSEDQGVYSCTAKNDAGRIIANATLKVHNKPTFVRVMQERIEIMEQKTAVLECFTSGSPQPKLTWKKDGQPLELTDRHFFAANHQLLLILLATPEDSGHYTCSMQNTLGTERGATELVVFSSGPKAEGAGKDQTTTTGIIIIAVVCCVVGTSLIWVIIIYQTRKRTEEYSSTPTDETTLPGEMPSTPYHYTEGSSPGLLAPHLATSFGRYPMCNGGFGYSPSPHHMRSGAIFPSDLEDDDQRLSVPLTQDEQQPAEASENSITLLRRLQPSTNSDSGASTGSPRSSTHSTRSAGLLQTFQPHPAPQHHPLPPGEAPTVAIVHPVGGHGSRQAFLVQGGRPQSLAEEPDSGSEADSDYYTGPVEPASATFPRHHKHNTSSNTSTIPHPSHRYHPPHPARPPTPPRGDQGDRGRIPHPSGDYPASITHSGAGSQGHHQGHWGNAVNNQTLGSACPAESPLPHQLCHSDNNNPSNAGDISLDYQSEAPTPPQTVLPPNGNAIPNGAPPHGGDQTNFALPHRTKDYKSHTVECK